MPSLTPNPTFLLDENVHSRLYKFLKLQGIDTKLAPKALSDRGVAEICLIENRVLVTNDEDFQNYSANQIYSVVWLRIPQNKPDLLLESFSLLLSECQEFKGKTIILYELRWKDSPLYYKQT